MKIVTQPFILLGLMAAATQAHAAGIKEGGGGGGFCVANNCMTLAQAGLRIKSEPADVLKDGRYDLTLDQIDELRKIVTSIRGRYSNLLDLAIGGPTTFQKIESFDKKKFEKMVMKPYRELLAKASFPVDPKYLTIFAVSDSRTGKTYLLPEFFKLDLRGQALTLMHELNMRQGRESLETIVRLDIQLVKFLNHQEGIGSEPFDLMTFLYYANRLGWVGNILEIAAIEKIEKLIGRPLVRSDLCEEVWTWRTCQPKRETLLRLGSFDKRIPYALEGVLLYNNLYGVKLDSEPEDLKELADKCSKVAPDSLVLAPSAVAVEPQYVRCDEGVSSGHAMWYGRGDASGKGLYEGINYSVLLEE